MKGGKDGDKAIVRMTDWPENAKSPFARVLNVLGPSGNHNVEMHAILFEYGLPFDFPKEVKDAAASMSEDITAKEVTRRRDFREKTTFTIDPEDAKDFDDALSFETLDEELYRIGIHIADVSHYVEKGSVIDQEAYDRSTSVYLVDRVVPMLPEILSNVICSLRPNEDKLTFSVVVDITEDAELKKIWIGRTLIHSDRRFTYEEAQQIIEGEKGDYESEIRKLNELAKKTKRKNAMNKELSLLAVVRFDSTWTRKEHRLGSRRKR